jgi:alginate O-acetyltransferase complex protein AlgJ
VPQKLANAGLCVLFVSLLWAPMAARWLRPGDDTIESENRRAAPLPEFHFNVTSMKEFPRRFEAYFQDRLPFRERVLGIHNQFKIDALGASPSPNVIIGKDGYLFYTESPPGEDQKVLRRLSSDELKRWRDLFQARHDDLAKHGIPYLVVIAPDKQSIYPDFLPDLLRSRMPAKSRLDQLLEYLRDHSTILILDLRPALSEGRKAEQVYYKTDTHWNAVGGYLGYREIVLSLQKWLPHLEPLTREQLDYVAENRGGDLSRMIGATASEPCPDRFVPKQPRARFNRDRTASPFDKLGDLKHVPPCFSESDEPNPARLVMLNDSFGGPLEHLLAHHFRRVDFVPTYRLPRDLVVSQRPSVVVQEMVERVLYKPPVSDGGPQ